MQQRDINTRRVSLQCTKHRQFVNFFFQSVCFVVSTRGEKQMKKRKPCFALGQNTPDI